MSHAAAGGWVAPRIFKDERIVKITENLISFVRLIDQKSLNNERRPPHNCLIFCTDDGYLDK